MRVQKRFVERKPQTTCTLGAEGRKAFLAHLATLERIAQDGDLT